MDTMEATKIVASACGALLIFLLVGWGAESLYHVGGNGHGDGEEHATGYLIEVEEAGGGEAQEEGPGIEELLASADAGKGAKIFSKCKACHKVDDGANSTGPFLYGIFDRDIGSVASFAGYSTGMTSIEGNWDASNLDKFLAKPKALISDTKMSFAGLKKATDRANLIAYLQTVK